MASASDPKRQLKIKTGVVKRYSLKLFCVCFMHWLLTVWILGATWQSPCIHSCICSVSLHWALPISSKKLWPKANLLEYDIYTNIVLTVFLMAAYSSIHQKFFVAYSNISLFGYKQLLSVSKFTGRLYLISRFLLKQWCCCRGTVSW